LPFFRGFDKTVGTPKTSTNKISSSLMKKKSPSQLGLKLTKKNAVLLTVAVLALCASPTIAVAADCLAETFWTDTTGSWFVAANWLSGQLPTAAIGAQINNGGTAQVNGPGAVACDLTVGYNATESGTVSVDTGSLAVGHEAEIGAFGKGTLMIKNGGAVTAQFLTIAALPGASSAGTVSVSAARSTFTASDGVYVGGDPGGAGGIGLLTVTNGGTVTATSVYVFPSGTLTGNATVHITANYGVTIDGTLHPSGTLSITGNTTGNLTLHSSAAMLCNVVPGSADNVDIVSAGALINGRLAVTLTGTFTRGTRYTLLHAANGRINDSRFSSVSITFPPGQGFSPQINYDATHVYLDLVPNTGP
jgi:T5SS/PEP-CTERM-associated repeat protein